MSLKLNIMVNYTSQIYVALVGILVLPLYIKHMGAEAYGLVAFFTMLQTWFILLDLGLTPTISRETARYYGGAITALSYRKLFRALSSVFLSVAVLGGGCLWFFSELLATRWLHVTDIPISEVILAIQVMIFSVALRWAGGLYKGAITGAEQLVWLGGCYAFFATLRSVTVFISMYFFGFTPVVFFLHQLIAVLLEFSVLTWKCYTLLPKIKKTESIGWSFKPIMPVLKFSLSVAFTSFVWLLVTQADKMVLSGVLPLNEYGYFSLAVVVAGGILLVSGPISNIIMPRMARLHAQNRRKELLELYCAATKMVCLTAGVTSLTLTFGAESLLYAWSGDIVTANKSAPILKLYALGYGLLVVGAFPYYLQYAIGNLRLHLIGNAGMALLLVPVIFYVASHYGAIGAGWVWIGFNCAYLFIWTAYVHHRLAPGLHKNWLTFDVLIILVPVSIGLWLGSYILPYSNDRMSSFINFSVLGLISFSIAIPIAVIAFKNGKFSAFNNH